MTLRKLLQAIAALSTLAVGQSLADTSYPGSLCHPDALSARPNIHREDRGVFNRGGGTAFVSCPVLRDITQDVDGLRGLRVFVTGSVSCTLNGRDFNGSLTGDDGTRDTASYTGSGDSTLYLSTWKGYAGGPYEFACNLLSNGSGITGYYADE